MDPRGVQPSCCFRAEPWKPPGPQKSALYRSLAWATQPRALHTRVTSGMGRFFLFFKKKTPFEFSVSFLWLSTAETKVVFPRKTRCRGGKERVPLGSDAPLSRALVDRQAMERWIILFLIHPTNSAVLLPAAPTLVQSLGTQEQIRGRREI